MDNAKNLFKKQFGFTPFHQTRSPAVVELLGGFAGIYDGLCIAIPIEKNVEVVASPRMDGKVEVVFSEAPQCKSSFRVSDNKHAFSVSLENYLKTVITKLHKREAAVGGFDAAVFSPMPISEFMGLIPSYLIAMTLTIRKLYPFRLTETGTMLHPPPRDKYGYVEPPSKNEKIAIAGLCSGIRKEFSAFNTDAISELTCLFGKKYHAVCVDCRHNSFEHIPVFGEIAIIVFKIKKEAEFKTREIEKIFSLNEKAKISLSTKSLRSVDLEYLKSRGKHLPQDEYDLAYYAIGEIQRVIFGERALEDGDFSQFGQYMIFSHESARDLLHIVPDDIERLFQISIEHKGCLGSRMICDGTASATVNIVLANYYQDFIHNVSSQFSRETGFEVEPIICVPSDSAA